MSEYHTDYPTERISRGNPYRRCVHCKRSDPEINGRLDGHMQWCEYRKSKEAQRTPTEPKP